MSIPYNIIYKIIEVYILYYIQGGKITLYSRQTHTDTHTDSSRQQTAEQYAFGALLSIDGRLLINFFFKYNFFTFYL